MTNKENTLIITSTSFDNNSIIPKKHTGFGEDVSPPFAISGLSKDAVSIAIVMDDLDIPFIKAFNHWLIWNIPAVNEIPENIPHGKTVTALGNAKQGIGYGHNRYRGPKQPFFVRNRHRYIFHIYALDCFLNLSPNSKKRDFITAANGHIIQYGQITGIYKRGN